MGVGEITFCGAIEMAGYLDSRVNLIKSGVAKCPIEEMPDQKTGTHH